MARGPYIPEEQTADWTSQGIRDFFAHAGFRVVTYKVSQHLERDMPADRAFMDPGTWKVFGFQYKTLYHNREDRWPLDRTQHKTLRQFRWIYYCFSALTEPAEANTALHQVRIYRPTFSYRPAILAKAGRRPRYFTWGEFYQGLKRCKFGKRLWSKRQIGRLINQLEGVARQRQARQMYEVFLAEFDRRLLYAPGDLPGTIVR